MASSRRPRYTIEGKVFSEKGGAGMTIRQRLLISHLTMFAAPVLMLLITVLTVAAGLFTFIQSGNHVYVESSDQYNRAADILYNAVFHGKRDEAEMDDTSGYGWLIQALDPEQNFVMIHKDSRLLYQYGNADLLRLFPDMPDPAGLHEIEHPDKGAFVSIRDNEYCTLRKRTVGDTPYYLCFISHQAPHGTDDRLEHVSRGTITFLGISLLAFIALTSWFLADFMIRRILPPLRALKQGAEQVEQGDLSVRLSHGETDEFTPVFNAFNTMTEALGTSLRQRAEEEENRKELIASMSHDIRTPLTAIKAYVEGLLDGVANTEEKRRRYLEVIHRKSDELDVMVEQLFLLSKMDVGDRAVPLEPVRLRALIGRIVEDNRDAFLRKGLRIVFQADTEGAILGNPLLIERILLNLFTNSAKYKDAPEGRLTLTLTASDGTVRLDGADDGPGVPEEALPHLFEAFYRTDKARTKTGSGSGLGLAIAARAMEIMHGAARAENGRPRGLVIRFSWPEAEDAADGAPPDCSTK